MSKKTILTSLVTIALVSCGVGYAQQEYTSSIDEGLDNFKKMLDSKNIGFKYEDKDALFFKDDIKIKNLTFTSPVLQEPVFIEEFIIDRNSFIKDHNDVYPFIKFEIKNGSALIPLINVKDSFDMNYLYSYDKNTDNFHTHFEVNFDKLFAATFNSDFDKATTLWNYPEKQKQAKGDQVVDSPEELKNAIGDLTLNNISLRLEDKELLNKLAVLFAMFAQGQVGADSQEVRDLFSNDMRKFSNKEDKMAKYTADFIQQGGVFTMDINPTKPLLIKEVIDELSKMAEEGKSDLEAIKYIENIAGIHFSHKPSDNYTSTNKNMNEDNYLEEEYYEEEEIIEEEIEEEEIEEEVEIVIEQ